MGEVQGNLNKAKTQAELALELANKLQHKRAIAGARITLSNIYISLNDYKQAESELLKIISDTNSFNNFEYNIKADIYDNLSQVYEYQNNLRLSLNFYRKYKDYNDSVLIHQRDSKVTALESKYQLEKKEQQVESLITEKKLQESELERKQIMITFSIALAMLIFSLAYFIVKRLRQKLSESRGKIRLKSRLVEINTLTLDQLNKQNRAYENLVQYLNDLKPFVSIEKRKEIQKKSNNFKIQSFDIPWLIFFDNFKTSYPNFIKNLYNTEPNLTKSEVKVSALIKAEMNTTEMRTILKTSNSNINTMKSRLREKLSLRSINELEQFIQNT